MIWIGIDPGVHTGLAVWDSKKQEFMELNTYMIHQAMQRIMDWELMAEAADTTIQVVFEDARQRKGHYDEKYINAKAQGAGSVKRDSTIWDDFLTDMGIPFQAVPPGKGKTKYSSDYFKTITGWKGRTSNHARDAAILVIGR